ncbi:MAG: lysylphosphatidylglycerol synthase transmembrane domain-containing protein [Cytophagales bacterium]|nr:flippase-like domain-containing protein [Bernardetiaceae bacterium]MDW8211154.1 lysylphosphatidylglycerol synthase transmembrane domain-containing protein [Cytophagales bacterium]
MKSKAFAALKYSLTFAIAVGLFWWLYRNQDFNQLWRNISQARWEWIAASIGISMLSHWSRGIRWAIMLRPLGYKAGTMPSLIAVMIGYLANLVVPRMGEVTRCAALQRMKGIPFQVAFGAVITERIFDMLLLAIFTLLSLWIEFDRIGEFLTKIFTTQGSPNSISDRSLLLVAVVLIMVGVVAGLYFTRSYWKQLLWTQRIVGFLKGLKDGMLSVLKLSPAQRFAFFLHTAFMWTCYYLTSYVLFFAMPATENLDWHCALAILMMSGISVVAPVQGGIGVYHLLITATLAAYGISQVAAQEFAFIAHSTQVVMFIGFGLIALALSNFFKPFGESVKMAQR